MSPEQIQGVRITPHSDLYALGCVLHELLSGRKVFDSGTEFRLMEQHVKEPPARLRQLRADVPKELELLVLDLLAKAPEQRPADAYAVYERLLPLLPPPGSGPPGSGPEPTGIPDPTLLYRRPNAPRPRVDAAAVASPPATPAAEPAQATAVRDAIKAAVSHSDALLGEERFTQAAEVLRAVIGRAAQTLGAESPRLLRLRLRRAAILVLGGDFRRALPEFDALVDAYTRTAGEANEEALECLRQAAHCRAELGQTSLALRQFQQVLGHARADGGDANPTALDLRHNIGVLLLSEGRVAEAIAELQRLYDDLCLVYGPSHKETQEVAAVLARLRLAGHDGTETG